MRPLAALAAAWTLAACGRSDAPAPPPRTEAQRLLAEAGFPAGRGFPRLTLLYNRADWHTRIAARVQENWRRELGLEIDLRNVEWRVYLDRLAAGDYDVARRAWIGEYLDPHAFLALFRRDSRANTGGWSSDAYERLMDAADAEPDPARRLRLLADAEKILLDEAAAAPIYHYVSHNYIKPFVRGVYPNVRDMHPLQGVTLEGPGAPADGVLIFNAAEEPASLDPALSQDIAGLKVLMHLFEGLTAPDPKDARAVPAAAERWEVSPDGTTWTFRLREARWSNGDPVTAHDFVWAWRRAADPRTASPLVDRLFVLRHARAVARGEAPPESLGVRAPDARTLVAELAHVAPYFPELLSLSVFFPVHRATVERHGAEWVRPGRMVHNGPYRLESWTFNDRKVFVRNPLYRAASEVKLGKFVFLSVADDNAAWRLYESGACHWLFRAPPDAVDTYANRPDHVAAPYNAVYYYVFNTRVRPLDDPRVRRALSRTIDRDGIVRSILRGGETPALRLVPPTSNPAPLPER
jgi:oligopeptide transport system substrate-binding protein